MTDYSKLSGAEFSREVGDDPHKWAAALVQAFNRRLNEGPHEGNEGLIGFFERWIADAMAAARATTPPVVVTYDADGNIRDATDDERTAAAQRRK